MCRSHWSVRLAKPEGSDGDELGRYDTSTEAFNRAAKARSVLTVAGFLCTAWDRDGDINVSKIYNPGSANSAKPQLIMTVLRVTTQCHRAKRAEHKLAEYMEGTAAPEVRRWRNEVRFIYSLLHPKDKRTKHLFAPNLVALEDWFTTATLLGDWLVED